MNIGIDARMYGPKQTGIGNYTKYLIEYLAKIDRENTYYVFLMRESFSSVKCQVSSFKKVLADFPWYSLAEQTLFLRTLLKYPLDVMHFPHFNAPLCYHKQFVVTIHDLTPKYFPGEKVGNSWLRRKAYEAVLSHAIKKSRAIITPSNTVKQDILKHFSVNPQKINVIYEGVPTITRKPANPQTVCNKKYILYVGVWRSHKNLKGLLEAFALLKRQGLPHKLLIVGEPDIYYNDISAHWKQLGLEGEIIATGFLQDDELVNCYERASLLVLPSFQEGFGLTPLQALSLGVQVAVSDIPVLREILGECAWYFNPHDPKDMARVIKKILEARIDNERIQILLNSYNWTTMAKKTLRLYQS